MSAASLLRYWYLSVFSRPARDRVLYRAIRRHHPKRLVELGLGRGERTRKMLRLALEQAGAEPVRYTGIDLFEGRPADRPGLTLKLAHRTLQASGAKVQLVPGDPFTALARVANGLSNTDFVVISADQDPEALERAWIYVPRMLHAHSLVFQEVRASEDDSDSRFELVSLAELERRAKPARRRAA